MPLTSEQLRDAFGLVDAMVECQARLPSATDDRWRTHLEIAIAESAQQVHAYLEISERSDWAERSAFEKHTINRALQHDLVLYGNVTAESALTFIWGGPSGPLGPRFDHRELAIDWIVAWLDDDTSGTLVTGVSVSGALR